MRAGEAVLSLDKTHEFFVDHTTDLSENSLPPYEFFSVWARFFYEKVWLASDQCGRSAWLNQSFLIVTSAPLCHCVSFTACKEEILLILDSEDHCFSSPIIGSFDSILFFWQLP